MEHYLVPDKDFCLVAEVIHIAKTKHDGELFFYYVLLVSDSGTDLVWIFILFLRLYGP